MENNIFENAKFGDKFLTRGGILAIFSHTYFSQFDNKDFAVLMIPLIPRKIVTDGIFDSTYSLIVTLDGKWDDTHNSKYDIISRYQEPIDEEKLDELTKKHFVELDKEYCDKNNIPYKSKELNITLDGLMRACQVAFKVGYRKAKEE